MEKTALLNLNQLNKIDNLELLARQVVEGTIIGMHKSPFHGFSVEFAEHRVYNQGEPIKNIDWKVYGRTDKLFVKRYEEETNLRCNIVIDTSSSMYFPHSGKDISANKITFSVLCAAAIIHLLKNQRDGFGLTTFAEEVEISTQTKTSGIHQRLILSYLHKLIDAEKKTTTTNAAKALHEIAENTHRRSLIMLFSDMFTNARSKEETEELFDALQHLKYNKHEVVLFHVTDAKHELDFKYDNRPHLFVDVETGQKVKVMPHRVKEFYQTEMKKFTKSLELKCAQFGIDYIHADIMEDFSQVLLPYLVKRNRLF